MGRPLSTFYNHPRHTTLYKETTRSTANMAKGLRASVTKRNKSKLRSRVFGPTEDARTERLSAKLLELAQQPKATQDTEMLVDGQSSKDQSTTTDVEDTEKAAGSAADDMEIDSGAGKVKPAHSSSSKSSKKGKGRVEKKSSKPRKIRDKIGRA